MKLLYHTILTSSAHRDRGSCEENDFAKLELYQVTDQEAPVYCWLSEYNGKPAELRLFNGKFYSDSNMWDRKKLEFSGKQGYFTEQTARQEIMKIRKKNEESTSYTNAHTESYILVGRKLFKEYCKRKELVIGHSSNLMFGNWYDMTVETPNSNKTNVPFNYKRFNSEVEKTVKWLKKKGYWGRIDEHVAMAGHREFHFSCTKIKWGPGAYKEAGLPLPVKKVKEMKEEEVAITQ